MRTEVELQIHRKNFEIELSRHMKQSAYLRAIREGQCDAARSRLGIITQRLRAIGGTARVREACPA